MFSPGVTGAGCFGALHTGCAQAHHPTYLWPDTCLQRSGQDNGIPLMAKDVGNTDRLFAAREFNRYSTASGSGQHFRQI